MQSNTSVLKRLLPHGAVAAIAKKMGITSAAVSQALKKGRPSSPVVLEALRIVKESGAIEAEKTLAALAA